MILRGITYKNLNLQKYSKFVMNHKAAAATVLEFIAKKKRNNKRIQKIKNLCVRGEFSIYLTVRI
jgi:uncharacterized protein (UPF0128 family)